MLLVPYTYLPTSINTVRIFSRSTPFPEPLPPCEHRRMSTKKQPVDLNLISTAFHHGCMRVPQELVDEIMNMLCDDPSALRACSLTCRAMFASVRPLIHRKLYLNLQTDLIAMRIGDKQTGHALGFLTFMGERDLLRYTRQIHVGFLSTFTPDTLRPHLHHFQSLDRVHSLTIGSYAANKWARYFNTYFTHLYPSLTSLSLCFSSGHYRLLLQFVLQFPNLENLCLEHLVHQEEIPIYLALPAIPDKSPPLSGHLRLCDPEIGDAGQWVVDLAYNLPNGIKFRSIELEHFSGQHAQHIVNACGRTLENLIIVISGNGTYLLLFSWSSG